MRLQRDVNIGCRGHSQLLGAPKQRCGPARLSANLRTRHGRRRAPSVTVASIERDPLGGNGGCAPADRRDFAIFWPKCFREAAMAVHSLQQGCVVVVNVGGIPNLDDQQRAVDFVAGGCFALEGQQDMLGQAIFIFSPGTQGARKEGFDPQDAFADIKQSASARSALLMLAKSELAAQSGSK